jgi:hypothetical protein
MIPSDAAMASLCGAIYDNGCAPVVTWDHLDSGPDDGIYWALKKLEGFDVVVLRGSEVAHDWVEDFRAFPVKTRIGTVHRGFYDGMEKMWSELAPMLTQPVLVTGHSLGAARADILCALMVASNRPPVRRAAFGEPRPGMRDFAQFLKDVPGNGYRNQDANGHDLVTDVPLDIHLVGLFGDALDFIHPKLLAGVTASPTGDFFARHEAFAYHHIQLYMAATAALQRETASC